MISPPRLAAELKGVLISSRIVIFDPNIAVEDIPREQALLASTLPSTRQRFKPALGNASK